MNLDPLLLPILAAVFAAVAAYVATPLAIRLAQHFGAMDDPARDGRRIHTQITPRWGGLPIFGGFAFGLLLVVPFIKNLPELAALLSALLLGGAVMTYMGLVDDRQGLSAPQQLSYMLAVGCAVQIFGISLQGVQIGPAWVPFHPVVSFFATAAFLFTITKTFDTIDGVDGLATGLATISSIALVVISYLHHQPANAVIPAAMAGACIGFLPRNVYPAKIFLAGGAQVVGLVLAVTSIHTTWRQSGTLATWIPLTIFGVPVLDAVMVVIRRVLAKQRITQGDRRHIHHVLLNAGLSKPQVSYVLWAVSIVLCTLMVFLSR